MGAVSSRQLDTLSNIITGDLPEAGNTEGGSITVRLTSCLTGFESAV